MLRITHVRDRNLTESRIYPKAEFDRMSNVPKFRSVDWTHDIIIVKWHLLIWHKRKLCARMKAEAEFDRMPNVPKFRSVDWTHDIIIVKWHLLIWHKRKLCALTNRPPAQSTRTGQWLSTSFHANCYAAQVHQCPAPLAIHLRSKLQVAISFAGISFLWAPRRIF